MAKKSAQKSSSVHPLKRKYVVHKRLEQPVHNLVGYGVLLVLAVVTYLVATMQRF